MASSSDLQPLHDGIAAAIRGDRESARRLLWRATSIEPRNELAWLWLSKVAENNAEYEFSLARALVANPDNERARSSLLENQDEPNHSERPPSHGQCVICDLGFAVKPFRCVRCRSILCLADIDAFFELQDVDLKLLRQAADRLGHINSVAPNRRYRILALIHLNLGQYAEALEHLRAAAHLAPRDQDLAHACREVSERLGDGQTVTGFETDAIEKPSHEQLGLSTVSMI